MLPRDPTASKLQRLPWTSLYGKTENDSYHFFSAYYDDRPAVPGSPAVLVMGYVYKDVPTFDFYCSFIFSNGVRACSKKPATRKHPTRCFTPSYPARPFVYTCSLGAAMSLASKVSHVSPVSLVSVQISTAANCNPRLTSGEIPVGNFNHTKLKAPKKFGVCVQSPMIQEQDNGDFLQDVVEFIEMSRLLGAEVIVAYVNETQVSSDVLDYIWSRYPHTVRTIGWRKFKKWYPMHYRGQLLLISDCLYRLMYEVEYLAMIDLDEVLMPVKHKNWHEMVKEFNSMYSTFAFGNVFFDSPSKVPPPKKLPNCHNMTLPKYFHRTRRYKCSQTRTKSISRPRLIVEPSTHLRCKAISGQLYRVPQSLAINAHYRNVIPAKECTLRQAYVDTVAMQYKDSLISSMCS